MYSLLQAFGLVVVLSLSTCCLVELMLYLIRRPLLQQMKSIKTRGFPHPIIGHARYFWGGPERIFLDTAPLYKWYPDNPNIVTWAFHKLFVHLRKPEDIALTLNSTNCLNKSFQYKIFRESIAGNGIFSTTNLAEWHTNRKLINPAFHFQILKTFINHFYKESNILAGTLINKMEEDGEVDVWQPMGLCTLDMIMQSTMGTSINAQRDSKHVFTEALETVLNVLTERLTHPWLWSEYIFGFSSLKAPHDKAMHDIQFFATEIILSQLEARCQDESLVEAIKYDNGNADDCMSRKPKVFLDIMIENAYDGVDKHLILEMIKNIRGANNKKSNKKGFCNSNKPVRNANKNSTHGKHSSNTIRKNKKQDKRISKQSNFFMSLIDKLNPNKSNCNSGDDEDRLIDSSEKLVELERIYRQLRDEVVTIMIAGQETTGSENSFTVLMLAIHPEVQTKVAAELADIFGTDSRPPCYEDLQRMDYLECVIKETMRLYPAAAFVGRDVDENTVLSDGTVVAKGVTLIYSIYWIHRNPEYYTDPDEFIPERFLPENARSRHPCTFIPFTVGKRNCIGQKYAMFQMKTIISTLVRRFTILPSERMPTIDSIHLKYTSTLHSKTGCWVKLKRRN